MPENTVSVLLPAGPDTNPTHLQRACFSIQEQTQPPDEIVIVTNPPLPDSLQTHIETMDVTHIHAEDAHGLGDALQAGLESCSGTYVARMDADDIALDHRLERQLDALESRDVDIVGSQLAEFSTTPENPDSIRSVPESHDEIAGMMASRCPLNHPTVMFRRDAVLSAGGYQSVDLEDWDLWARCLRDGLQFQNLPEVTVLAHAGDDLMARRGGFDYALAEIRMQQRLFAYGLTTTVRAVRSLSVRIPPRFLPGVIRKQLYRVFVRDSPEGAFDFADSTGFGDPN